MTRSNSPIDEAIRQAAARYGLPESYLYRVAQIESGGNPNARNPRSSAGGLYQFIDSTAKQYGLQDRFDPIQAADAMGILTRDNRNHLSRVLGRAPSEAELYLAHQQGAGGAARLLQNPHAQAAQIVGSNAVGLNGGNRDMRAGDFVNHVLQMYGGQQPSRHPAVYRGSVAQGGFGNRENLLQVLRALLASQEEASEDENDEEEAPLMSDFMRAFYGPFYRV
ncbi:transglycosylase SLT domain-containing protein [Bartonella machadoae]|uniref:transglycosylase SLT domain-containing protein n=1 Tax=Bartonella machadoae TaxID=2893471 RepID=UPI001F4C8802|nr:transglycosylase SLT domain-containing protein [Bartonella machadoae]UNE54977.1 transglycosylase SLT domain-containing protein [Bartonella machadoae]